MATLIDLDGFTNQTLQTSATAPGASGFIGTYDTAAITGGGVTFDRTVKRHASSVCSLKLVYDGTNARGVGRSVVGTQTLVGSFYFLCAAIPNVDTAIFRTLTSIHTVTIKATTGFLEVKALGATVQANAASVCDSNWHRLDFRCINTTTHSLEWYLDGTIQTTSTIGGQAAANMTGWVCGNNTPSASTATVWFADFVLSATSGDYPIGEHHVLPLYPNADGTHNLAAHIVGEGAETTNLYQKVRDWDLVNSTTSGQLPDTATYLHQTVIDATAFAEFAFSDPNAGESAIWDVFAYVGGFASTTGADTAATQILTAHAGTVLGFVGNNASNTGLIDYSGSTSALGYTTSSAASSATVRAVVGRPSGGWDTTKLGAVVAQWGFAGDVVGEPRLSAILLEYAAPEANVAVTTTTVAAVSAVPAPAGTANADTTPTTVLDSATVPTPVVTILAPDASVTTTTVLSSAAVPTPVVAADANVTPATVAAVASVPGVASVTATATLTTTTVPTTTLISTPVTTADARAPPDTVAVAAAVPTATAAADADTTADTVTGTVEIPTPTVDTFAGNHGDIAQSIPAFEQSAIGVRSFDADVTPDPVLAFVDVLTPIVNADANVTPATVEAVASVSTVFQASTSIDLGGPPEPPGPGPSMGGARLVPIRSAVHGKIRQTMPMFTQSIEGRVTDDELVLLLI